MSPHLLFKYKLLPFAGARGLFDCDCACAAAPNYAPVAAASAEAAQLSEKLGQDQLAEAKRQYDLNMAVAKPVTDAELQILNQSKQQGDDYYNYQKEFRPAERQMLADASSPAAAASAAAERDAISGTDAAVYNGNKADIDNRVNQAVADSQGSFTRTLNQIARQGLRYGGSPSSIAAQAGSAGISQASNVAAAANGTRGAAISDARTRLMSGRNMRIQDDSLGWAKRLDAVGLAKGLPGASQGAYSVATNAGNSAVGNAMAPGQALASGMNQSASTTMSGRQMALGGLTGIMNAQASYANGVNSAMSSGAGGTDLGSLVGAGVKLYSMSDPRSKENIVLVGKDESSGLNLYEFNYIGDANHRYRGVMADEVERYMPDAVAYDDLGFASVNYGMIGIEMEEI
jgi:hypothetical protein